MTDFNITPPELPDEQLDQWLIDAPFFREGGLIARDHWLCKTAITWATPIVAQQVADAELDACIKRQRLLYGNKAADDLRTARRPKPPSLKDQAINALCPDVSALTDNGSRILSPKEQKIILRALESIPDEPPTP